MLIPKPSLEIYGDVLINEEFKEDTVIDCIHYPIIVMSRSNRQSLVSEDNVDQDNMKSVSGMNWFVDSRVGYEHQAGHKAYKKMNLGYVVR